MSDGLSVLLFDGWEIGSGAGGLFGRGHSGILLTICAWPGRLLDNAVHSGGIESTAGGSTEVDDFDDFGGVSGVG